VWTAWTAFEEYPYVCVRARVLKFNMRAHAYVYLPIKAVHTVHSEYFNREIMEISVDRALSTPVHAVHTRSSSEYGVAECEGACGVGTCVGGRAQAALLTGRRCVGRDCWSSALVKRGVVILWGKLLSLCGSPKCGRPIPLRVQNLDCLSPPESKTWTVHLLLRRGKPRGETLAWK